MNTISNTDAIEFLKSLPDDSVDLFFTDPPYNLNKNYDSSSDNMSEDEYIRWCVEWLTEAVRILKPGGALFLLHIPKYAIPLSAFLQTKLTFQHWIVWNAMGAYSKRPVMPAHYAILYFTKGKPAIVNEVRTEHKRCRKCGELIADYGGKKHLIHPVGPLISDVWNDIGRAKHKQRQQHPCKLPERLVERILKIASNPGSVIVDPFVGAGTTAVIAKQMDREYWVNDLSPTYVGMTKENLNDRT